MGWVVGGVEGSRLEGGGEVGDERREGKKMIKQITQEYGIEMVGEEDKQP